MGQAPYSLGNTDSLECCPECGELVPTLDDETGWCYSCAGTIEGKELALCSGCGQPFPKDQPSRDLCYYCRQERWLARNADAITEYLLQGYSIGDAERKVRNDNRPICKICGGVIHGGRANDTKFCNKTGLCRKFRQRYRRLLDRSRRDHPDRAEEVALQRLMTEVHIYQQAVADGKADPLD